MKLNFGKPTEQRSHKQLPEATVGWEGCDRVSAEGQWFFRGSRGKRVQRERLSSEDASAFVGEELKKKTSTSPRQGGAVIIDQPGPRKTRDKRLR